MAGNYYSGRDGALTFNGQRVAKVAGWSLSGQVETMETTSLADEARTFVPGLQGATGSATIWMHRDNAAAETAAAPLLNKVLRSEPLPDGGVYRMELTFGDRRLAFECVLTSAQLGCEVGAVMQTSIGFMVTGQFAEAVV